MKRNLDQIKKEDSDLSVTDQLPNVLQNDVNLLKELIEFDKNVSPFFH